MAEAPRLPLASRALRRLNYEKCTFCRKDKKKCEPVERDWPRQRCDRCARMCLPCSPNGRSQPHRPSPPRQLPPYDQPPNTDVSRMGGVHARGRIIASQRSPISPLEKLKELSLRNSWIRRLRGYTAFLGTYDELLENSGLSSNAGTIRWEISASILEEQDKIMRGCRDLLECASLGPEIRYAALAFTNKLLQPFSPEPVEDLRDDISKVSLLQLDLIESHRDLGDIERELWLRHMRFLAAATSEADQGRNDRVKQVLVDLLVVHARYISRLNDVYSDMRCSVAAKEKILPLMSDGQFIREALRLLPNLPTATDFLGRTLLHVALDILDDECIEDLRNAYISPVIVNQVDQLGRTPLHIVAMKGSAAAVDMLAEKKASICKDLQDRTPIHYAAAFGHEAVLARFNTLYSGYRLSETQDAYGFTPLSLAAMSGHAEAIECFIHSSHDLGEWDTGLKGHTDRSGRTPLHWAAANGHHTAVVCLTVAGEVAPNITDNFGETPLSLAAACGHEKVVTTLLGATAQRRQADQTNRQRRTPLSQAAENGHASIVAYLSSIPEIDPDSRDILGCTPLAFAAENGHLDVVETLLATGRVNPDIKDEAGETPLEKALRGGHVDVMRVLLSHARGEHLVEADDSMDFED